MGKYGDAAIRAVEIMKSNECQEPRQAWDLAMIEIFPTQTASRDKGCPRGAFLGLCEAGAVNEVKPGSYTKSRLNKEYALEALRLLKGNQALASDPFGLWRSVMKGTEKVENGQMDVVISLWDHKLTNSDAV